MTYTLSALAHHSNRSHSALLLLVLGEAALAGICVMVLFLAFTIYVGRRLKGLRDVTLRKTDARMDIVNEVLNGIKIIKFNAWEQEIAHKMNVAR